MAINTTKSFRQLEVWQRGIELTDMVYTLTASFPKEELYGLTQQLRRAIVSVPSNIAEGSSRGSKKEFIQFLWIAKGSLAESETQLIIAMRRKYICTEKCDGAIALMQRVEMMIVKLIQAMQQSLRSTINVQRSTTGELA